MGVLTFGGKFRLTTILVVQEHREVHDVLIRELQTKGYLILDAQDAVEALRIVVRHSKPIDLFLADDSDQARIMAASLKPYRSDMNVIHISRDLEPSLILKEVSKVLEAHGLRRRAAVIRGSPSNA
jgi:CheY-like chemotaxis protein